MYRAAQALREPRPCPVSARPPLQSASQAPPWSPVSEMPASGNVAPANPDLACFGAGPSAHKRTPVAGVDGRASDPPRRAFVRRLETVMWREDAVHVEALAGGDGRGVLESQAGARRVAGERGRRRRASEHRARCAVPLIRTRPPRLTRHCHRRAAPASAGPLRTAAKPKTGGQARLFCS